MTELEMGVNVPQGNETFQVFLPVTLEVSMVKKKGGQESKGNFEEDNAGSKVHGSDGNLASSFSEAEEAENMTEKGGDNAVSKVHKKNSIEKSNIVEEFGSDSSKTSICDSLNVSQSNCHVKPEEEETMTEKGGDNAGSEVHKNNSREKSDIGEAFGSGSSKYQIMTV
eukprot:11980774-Ditylum_brightwellii.AAC.1